MEYKNLWAFKSVSDEDRSYKSIEGYDDDLATRYVYDNYVPNHKQVKEDDWALIIDKESVLGCAKIESIRTESSEKIRRRCPECGGTNFEARKTKSPLYRCNRGHEFDAYVEEIVPVTNFIASYGKSFVKPSEDVSIYSLRPYYLNSYNRNMSIQLLSMNFFDFYLKKTPRLLSKNVTYLLPTDAAKLVEEPDEPTGYFPGTEDDREKINRQIRQRRGQKKFRDALLKRYGKQCMVTGCELLDIIEAAHIKAYRGENDNHASNGLLLRSDIHTLFDLDLIGIDPETMMIHIHNKAQGSGYDIYNETLLKGCSNKKRPSVEALLIRWEKFNKHN